jgi:type II secretory pathway component PulJ
MLEVLLAIGLTTLLMAALYASMNIYWQLAVDSHDEIERSQIARAILRQMSRDIQSCTFIEQTTTDSSSDEDYEDDTSTDTDSAIAGYTNGLIGTSNDLVLYISRPDRDLNYYNAQELAGGQDRSSDLAVVRYLIADSQLGGLSAAIADQASATGSGGTPGLARMYGDLAGLSNAIQAGDIDMQLDASEILAHEVAGISFSYYDGVEWQAEWDSTAMNMIPLAIEVVLTLQTLDQDGQPDLDSPRSLPLSEHRLVVPIPVATPYVGDTSL